MQGVFVEDTDSSNKWIVKFIDLFIRDGKNVPFEKNTSYYSPNVTALRSTC